MAIVQWPGTVGPSVGTPPRRPRSVRRTTSIDVLRPEGLDGQLVLEGRGRDLLTTASGASEVLERASTTIDLTAGDDRRVAGVRLDPAVVDGDRLLGASASAGYRRALDGAFPALTGTGSLLALLLDEVPVMALISRSILSRWGGQTAPSTGKRLLAVDVCAGWVTGGTLAIRAQNGSFEPSPTPPAPVLDPADDAEGWHQLDPLPPTGMRRRRRMDVLAPIAEGEPVIVDAMFRDELTEPGDRRTVLHEYSLLATVDPAARVVQSVSVTAHVLPAPECPAALASAQGIVGRPLGSLRNLVRAEFRGPSTCTHLNDQLRALGDLDALVDVALAAPSA